MSKTNYKKPKTADINDDNQVIYRLLLIKIFKDKHYCIYEFLNVNFHTMVVLKNTECDKNMYVVIRYHYLNVT